MSRLSRSWGSKAASAGAPAAKRSNPLLPRAAAPAPARRARPRRAAATAPELPKPQQALLNALADFAAAGPCSVDLRLVAVWARLSPCSSSYGDNLSTLREAGVVSYPQAGRVVATALLFPSDVV